MNTPDAPPRALGWKPSVEAFAASPAPLPTRQSTHPVRPSLASLRVAAICFATSGMLALAAAVVPIVIEQGAYVPSRLVLWSFHALGPTSLGLAVAAGLSARRSRVASLLAWGLVAVLALPTILGAWRLPTPDSLVTKFVAAAAMLAGSVWLCRGARAGSKNTAT